MRRDNVDENDELWGEAGLESWLPVAMVTKARDTENGHETATRRGLKNFLSFASLWLRFGDA